MITPLLLLVAVAGADAVGSLVVRLTRGAAARAREISALVAVLAWGALVVTLSFAAGVPVVGVALVGVVAMTWPIVSSRWVGTTVPYLALIALVTVFAFRFRNEPATENAVVAEWILAPGNPSWVLYVALVTLAVFLGVSGNVITRAALQRARVLQVRALLTKQGDVMPPSAPHTTAPQLLSKRWSTDELPADSLRGGRLIGPLERWLIVGLSLLSVPMVIAALLAAKGIVRFPEINRNAQDGAKAEEFLIGSFVSWSLAAAGAGFLWAVVNI